MPKSPNESQKSRRQDNRRNVPAHTVQTGNNVKFINYTLSDDQMAHFRAWYENGAEFGEYERIMLGQGYSFKIKSSRHGYGVSLFVIPPPDHEDNAGKLLCSYGSTTATALGRAMFVHFDCLGEVWEQEELSPVPKDFF